MAVYPRRGKPPTAVDKNTVRGHHTRLQVSPVSVPPKEQPFFCTVFAEFPLANIKSAEKRASQAVKRRAHNMTQRSRMRTAIKKVRAALDAGKPEDAAAALKAAQPVIDSMVNKGIIHKNAAARYKSRLAAGAKKAAAAK